MEILIGMMAVVGIIGCSLFEFDVYKNTTASMGFIGSLTVLITAFEISLFEVAKGSIATIFIVNIPVMGPLLLLLFASFNSYVRKARHFAFAPR
jgi:hypothetical protein